MGAQLRLAAEMSEKTWAIQVTLTNGDRKLLSGGGRSAEEAIARLMDLEQGTGAFEGNWCETEDSSLIAKVHIVEAAVVPRD
jgi:hypothetical protein